MSNYTGELNRRVVTALMWLAAVLLVCFALQETFPKVFPSRAMIKATQIKVCASGCPFNNTQVQAALDSALPGDEVLLQGGFTYSAPDGGFVLGAQCYTTPSWDCITLRTGVTSSGTLISTSSFPASGVRIPAVTYRGTLAKLIPTVNNSPALRTIYPGETGPTCSTTPCRGDGWTVKWLEFGPKVDYAQRALVRFGSNNAGREWNGSCGTWPDPTPSCWDTEMPGGDTQDRLIEIPRYLTFYQNDVHGDPFVGQHQGMFLATKDARILNNSFTDIKSLAETQALYGINGVGPYTIENNLFEATGENTMFGGGDPYLYVRATVSGSPTTTSIPLSTPIWWSRIDTTTLGTANLTTDVFVDQFVGILHGGTWYTGITCTVTSSTCAISPALPFTPTVGDTVQWDWIHGGVTFRYNLSRKEPSWLQNILTTPTLNTPTPSTGGSLSAGSHCYKLIWFAFVSGAEPDAASAPSAEQCVTTAASGRVTLTWTGDSHATRYWIYGNGTTGTENKSWEIAAGTTTFTDTGAGGTANTPYATGTYWTIKNTHEWKGCEGGDPARGPCLIEGNIIEYNRCCTQNNTVSIKVNNQDSLDFSDTVRNFIFRNNWVRHGNRAISLSAGNADTYTAGLMRDVTISNNLFTDSSSNWKWPTPALGGDPSNYSAIYMGSGYHPVTGLVGQAGCLRCTWTHNSFFVNTADMSGPIWFDMNVSTDKHTDLIIRNNIMARDCPTCSGSESMKTLNPSNAGLGTVAWTAATSGSSFGDHNAFPDGSASTYTAGPFTSSFFPTDATLKSTHLVNYTNCDNDTDILGCGLVSGSSMHNAASDSTDIGANVSTIKAFTDLAASGGGGGGGGTNVPTFQSSGNGGSASASSIATSSFAISGTDRYLVCAVATQDTTKTATSVVFNTTVTLTQRHTRDFNNAGVMAHIEYWDFINPPVVTGTAVATMSAATPVSIGCIQYTGVDQTTPYGTFIDGGASSNTASVTAASAAGELVIDTTAIRVGTTGITEGTGQTNRVEKQSASGVGNVTLGMSEKAGASSIFMSWGVDDATSKSWAMSAVSLHGSVITPPPAGSPVITTTSPL